MLGLGIRHRADHTASNDSAKAPERRQAQANRSLCQTLWFVGLQGAGSAAFDGAKATGTSADIAENHESSSLLRITFHAVGAFRVVADRFQVQLIQQVGGEVVGISLGNTPLEPSRQATIRCAGVQLHQGQGGSFV